MNTYSKLTRRAGPCGTGGLACMGRILLWSGCANLQCRTSGNRVIVPNSCSSQTVPQAPAWNISRTPLVELAESVRPTRRKSPSCPAISHLCGLDADDAAVTANLLLYRWLILYILMHHFIRIPSSTALRMGMQISIPMRAGGWRHVGQVTISNPEPVHQPTCTKILSFAAEGISQQNRTLL